MILNVEIKQNLSGASHFSDYFALNRTILKIFAVKILRSITHSMSSISNDWNLHIAFIRKSKHFSIFCWCQCTFLHFTQSTV